MPLLVTGEVSWSDATQHDEAIAWGREFWAAMGRHSTAASTWTFPGQGEERDELVRAAYGVDDDRLTALKAKYGPATSSA